MELVYSEQPTEGIFFELDEFFDCYRVIGRTKRDKIVDFFIFFKSNSEFKIVENRQVIIKDGLINLVLK